MMKVKTKRNLTRKRVICGMILCLLIIVPIFLVCGDFLTSKKPKFIFETKPNSSVALSNEIVICNAEGTQRYMEIARDGFGGAIITWRDTRDGNDDIYAQKIDSDGIIQWGSNGTAICNTPENQFVPNIINDGNGEAIITWYDARKGGGNEDIYAQKVDSTGIIQWENNGTLISNATNKQIDPDLVSDGDGGAIITWSDYRNGNSDIYAQKIDSNGNNQWENNGTVICNANDYQSKLNLITDGNGGAIITWNDNREGNWDIYAQKIDSNGNNQWENNGTIICNNSERQALPEIINDGSGNIIFTWYDYREGNQDIYAQKVDSSGTVQWQENGIVICNAQDFQNIPQLTSDDDGGAIITWPDNRTDNMDIYAQRVDPSGTIKWLDNGIAICDAVGKQRKPTLISDGDGGAIIVWSDERGGLEDDIYAQRINSSGANKWEDNGIVICNASDTQESPKIVKVNKGKSVVAWNDKRDDLGDIYAKLITFETKATEGGGGEIPSFNPLILVVISIITFLIVGVHKIKKNQI